MIIFIPAQDEYEIDTFIDGSILTISDAPWPGLTPDLLKYFPCIAAQAKGSVLIHQKMFESRLFFVDKLIIWAHKLYFAILIVHCYWTQTIVLNYAHRHEHS